MIAETYLNKVEHGFVFAMPDGQQMFMSGEEAMSFPWWPLLSKDDLEQMEFWRTKWISTGWGLCYG